MRLQLQETQVSLKGVDGSAWTTLRSVIRSGRQNAPGIVSITVGFRLELQTILTNLRKYLWEETHGLGKDILHYLQHEMWW